MRIFISECFNWAGGWVRSYLYSGTNKKTGKDSIKVKEKLQRESIAFPSKFFKMNLETIENSNLCIHSWSFVVLLCFEGFLILTVPLK